MDIWLIVVIVTISVFLLVFVIERIIAAHKNQVSTGREDLIGKSAVVRKGLNPEGTVFVEGEIWQAKIDSGAAEPGEYVIIKKTDGLILYVSKNSNQGGN
ncbi:MAG: NfeD family protein [Dehalococcoidales bacterium]|nr:NfeD family protein [Dehalococcoidales bacterium]NLT27831.1 serine protease [Dehalococcoidales bacterium]